MMRNTIVVYCIVYFYFIPIINELVDGNGDPNEFSIKPDSGSIPYVPHLLGTFAFLEE